MPTEFIHVFCTYIKTKSDYSEYSITETESVYRAVRAECLNVVNVIAIIAGLIVVTVTLDVLNVHSNMCLISEGLL